jgi:hypothetical protein
VEVGLPVDGVAFVAPGHAPDRDAGHGDGRVAGRAGAESVFDVVPIDEQRQRLADIQKIAAWDPQLRYVLSLMNSKWLTRRLGRFARRGTVAGVRRCV